MPTLARPSLSRRQRSTPSARWPSATSRQPVSQPSPRLVEPRGSIEARARRASRYGLRGASWSRRPVDLVVVGDDGEAVVAVEPAERLLDGRLGQGQLGARHRARAVDDEGEVDRRTGARPLAVGAVTVARTNRWLRYVERTSSRSWRMERVMRVLLEDLPGQLDEPLDALVLDTGEGAPDVELDVRVELDAVPLRPSAAGGRGRSREGPAAAAGALAAGRDGEDVDVSRTARPPRTWSR